MGQDSFIGDMSLACVTRRIHSRHTGGGALIVLPVWAGEMQQYVTSVVVAYVSILVVVLLLALAVCRLASAHMVARSGGGKWEGGLMRDLSSDAPVGRSRHASDSNGSRITLMSHQ